MDFRQNLLYSEAIMNPHIRYEEDNMKPHIDRNVFKKKADIYFH